MSFIDGLMSLLGAIESDAIAVHEERCIAVRNRNADCLRCVKVCTSGALSYCDNELVVEPERCIGCGTCATACPTCAIELRNPSDTELTAQFKHSIVATNGRPVIVCEAALDAAGVGASEAAGACVVPCLGRVDESALVGLAAYRAERATLVCGTCEACPHATGGALVRDVVDGSRNLLAAFGAAMPVDLVDQVPDYALGAGVPGGVGGDGASRRDFFRSAKDASTRAAGAAVAEELGVTEAAPAPAAYRKVGADGTLSQFVPTRRVRLYNYLQHIGQPVADEVETRVIGAIALDVEKCSSCRMCAVFCPTGAIKKLDEDDLFGIIHRPSACMQCRLCERICPEGAIEVTGCVPIRQFMGKEAVCYSMKRPTWTPNKPASMYDKIHGVIGEDLEMCMF